MGLFIKNTTLDNNDNDIDIGSEVIIKDEGIIGVIVIKIGNLYQVKVKDEVKSYTYDEIKEKVIGEYYE